MGKTADYMYQIFHMIKEHNARIIGFMASCCICSIAIFAGYKAIEATSGAKFCGQCHTMEPMVQSYKQSVHGGMSKNGIRTKCTDCHLPHDNILHYLILKGITGANDVIVQVFTNTDKIDWEKKRHHREDYAYDSGCLKCHNNLKDATMANAKAFFAHKQYFLGVIEEKCVSCHKHVGHKELGVYLNQKNKMED